MTNQQPKERSLTVTRAVAGAGRVACCRRGVGGRGRCRCRSLSVVDERGEYGCKRGKPEGVIGFSVRFCLWFSSTCQPRFSHFYLHSSFLLFASSTNERTTSMLSTAIPNSSTTATISWPQTTQRRTHVSSPMPCVCSSHHSCLTCSPRVASRPQSHVFSRWAYTFSAVNSCSAIHTPKKRAREGLLVQALCSWVPQIRYGMRYDVRSVHMMA